MLHAAATHPVLARLVWQRVVAGQLQLADLLLQLQLADLLLQLQLLLLQRGAHVLTGLTWLELV
jgi:hypothetical protein